MAVGDFYTLKLSGNMLGQTILNIFHYEMITGSGGGSAELNTGFQANILTRIMAIASSDVTYTDIEIFNWDNGSDFVVDNFSQSGQQANQSSTSFLAWAFVLNAANINNKPGHKRFAGVASVSLQDNAPASAIITSLNSLASVLGSPIISGGNSYRPRHRYKIESNIEGVYNEGWVNINSAEFRRVSTQSTRKPWVGI